MEKKEGGMNDGQGTISGSTGVHQISTIPHSPSVQARDEAMNIEDASEFDGIPLAEEELPNEDTEDIIAFSIGQEQLRMKSPATPAFEKVRALHESESYFDLGPEVGDGNGDEGTLITMPIYLLMACAKDQRILLNHRLHLPERFERIFPNQSPRGLSLEMDSDQAQDEHLQDRMAWLGH